MDYLDWNDQLCRHFFCKTETEVVFPCLSKGTLSDICGLEESAAADDFVKAVKTGPKWTQIPRCQSIASKARNCLYPDPKWEDREIGDTREKLNLLGHIHWRQFDNGKLEFPPYFAYLCLLVISYTERGDIHGGRFYEPLNQLLGLSGDDQISCSDLGPKYKHAGKAVSINDLWNDLEQWSIDYKRGVCRLPDMKLWNQSYEFIPRYFGIFRPVDLRNLDRVFHALMSAGPPYDRNLPKPDEFAARVLQLDSLNVLSQDIVKRLQGQDPADKQAIGTLLLSRYRQWDGINEGEDGAPRQCGARLLRFLRSGSLQALVKLKSVNALRRLPALQPDIRYETDNRVSLAWPGNDSQWSKPIEFTPANKMVEASLECPELRLKARMSARSLLVMSNQGLPFHLKGGYLEVDEVEAGSAYLVLTTSEHQPNPGAGEWTRDNATRVPLGVFGWRMRIQEDPDPNTWPEILPPLTLEPRDPRPRIHLESPCRIEPRIDKFLTGFPVGISCRHGNLNPVLCDGDAGIARLVSESGGWELAAEKPCFVRIGLQRAGELIGETIRNVEFVDPEARIPRDDDLQSIIPRDPGDLSPYPAGRIVLTKDGWLKTRSTGEEVYLVDIPPEVHVDPKENKFQITLTAPGATSRSFQPDSLIEKKLGGLKLELSYEGTVLHAIKIELVNLPKIDVRRLSKDRALPTKFTGCLYASITCDEKLKIGYQIIGAKSGQGTVDAPFDGLLTEPRDAGMNANHIYEIQFSIQGLPVCSRWCMWVPPARRGGEEPRREPTRSKSDGLQGLGPIIDSVMKKKKS